MCYMTTYQKLSTSGFNLFAIAVNLISRLVISVSLNPIHTFLDNKNLTNNPSFPVLTTKLVLTNEMFVQRGAFFPLI